MIDYKAVVEDQVNFLKSFNIPIEYTITDTMVCLKIINYSYSETSIEINDEIYRHLLRTMLLDLCFRIKSKE